MSGCDFRHLCILLLPLLRVSAVLSPLPPHVYVWLKDIPVPIRSLNMLSLPPPRPLLLSHLISRPSFPVVWVVWTHTRLGTLSACLGVHKLDASKHRPEPWGMNPPSKGRCRCTSEHVLGSPRSQGRRSQGLQGLRLPPFPNPGPSGSHPAAVQLFQASVDPLLHVQSPLQLSPVVFDGDSRVPLLQPTRAAPRAAGTRRGLQLAQHALAQPLRCHHAAVRCLHFTLCLALGSLTGRGGAGPPGAGARVLGPAPLRPAGLSFPSYRDVQANVQASTSGSCGDTDGVGAHLRGLRGAQLRAGSRDTLWGRPCYALWR